MKLKRSQLEQLIKESLDEMNKNASKVQPSLQELNELLGSEVLLKEVLSRLDPERSSKIISEVVNEYDLKIPLFIMKNKK